MEVMPAHVRGFDRTRAPVYPQTYVNFAPVVCGKKHTKQASTVFHFFPILFLNQHRPGTAGSNRGRRFLTAV